MSMYYERKRNMRRRYTYGGGFFDSVISGITSSTAQQVAKDVATEVGKKALTEAGNRLSQKALNKIIPPPKGRGLNAKSRAIIEKYGIVPIQEFVKR